MDSPERLSYSDLVDFSGTNPITKAAKSLEALDKAYTQLATNLAERSAVITGAQQQLATSLSGLIEQAKLLNAVTESGRKNASKVAQDVDTQTRAYDALKKTQNGLKATTQVVADSLAGLRQQLAADRAEFVKLGQAASPEKLIQLGKSIFDTKTQADQLEKAARGVNSIFAASKGSYNEILNENRQLTLELKNLSGAFDANGQRVTQQSAREAELTTKLAANNKALAEYDAQLNLHFRNVGNYAESIISAVNALNQEKTGLTAQAQALRTAATATNLDAAAQNKLQQELTETNGKLATVNAKLADYGQVSAKSQTTGQQLASSVKSAGQSLKDFASNTILATVGLAAIAAGIKQVIGLNINYSDELADTAKTVGLTIEQTGELAESLKKIDTRDSIDELLKISEIGGQLGISIKDIEGFTKAIDIASIALKNDFGGNVELIATELGKINSIFKTSDKQGIEAALLNIGSAVNQLAASGAATAPFITDFAKRVGEIAKNSGLGLDKVLGLGAALEELGFSAEVAGTATNKLIGGLAANPKGFFEIAKLADTNLSLTQFKNLINNDVNGAFNVFLAGLRKGGTATTDFASLIASLKIKGTATTAVLTALAKSTELVAEKQAIANEQLDNGNSLAAEAAIKNDNLAASYNKFKNAIENAVTGNNAFSRTLKGIFDYSTQIVKGNIDVKESLLSLIPLYDRIQLLRAGNVGAALTLLPGVPTIKVKQQQKDAEDYGLAIALTSRQMQDAATVAETLYQRYQSLSDITNPTVAQQKELRTVTLQLQDALGDSVVTLDKERGQYVLNSDAVSKNITAKRSEASENALRLAQRVNQLDAEAAKEKALSSAISERLELTKAKLPASLQTVSPKTDSFVAAQKQAIASPGQIYGVPQISQADIANYEAYKIALESVDKASAQVTNTENARDLVLARLRIIYPDLINVNELLAAAQKEVVTATLPDVQSKKELEKAAKAAAKAIDELAKAQYELAKFRAENKATTFERQSDNVANSEDFRTAAAIKGAEQRKEVARLEEVETLRIATKEAAQLTDGDAVLRIKRQLISEQYAARIKEIERDLTKEQLAIHNELLEQLREIDKIRIDGAQAVLETIISDETQSYEVRTDAVKEYSANLILLAKAAYDSEVAAAEGSATKIEAALKRYSLAVYAAKDRVKPFDAEKANDTVDIDYKSNQIDLEKTRALGLVTEKEYQQQKQQLEDDYLKKHLDNTILEKAGTKAALDEELNLLKDKTDREIELEKKKRDAKIKLAEEVAETLGTIGNGLFEIQKANIDNEIAAVAAQRDNDIAVAGDNAKAKKKIEDDAARQTAALRRKQALADRSQALFNIALSTAVAVTKSIVASPETFGLPFSAFALANGVIQAGIVLAKPIPAYAKGIESAPAGLSLVGEAGAELLEYNGKSKLVTRPTLVNMQAGTRVVNATKTLKIFEERGLSLKLAEGYAKSGNIIANAQQQVSTLDVTRILGGEIGAKFESLQNAFENGQVGTNFSFDKDGFNASIINGQKRNTIKRNKYHRGE